MPELTELIQTHFVLKKNFIVLSLTQEISEKINEHTASLRKLGATCKFVTF